MLTTYDKVKNYLSDLDLKIVSEDRSLNLLVVENESDGIRNLVIDCEDPLVELIQLIMEVPTPAGDLFKRLLQINRTLIHGAFCLDDTGGRVLFRDTLQSSHLDSNELEASIRALSLGLAENGGELLTFIRKP